MEHDESDDREQPAPGTRPKPLKHSEEEVDRSSDASFPASDPPGWEPLHIGTPTDEDPRDDPRR